MNLFLEPATLLKMNFFLDIFEGFCLKVSEDIFSQNTSLQGRNQSSQRRKGGGGGVEFAVKRAFTWEIKKVSINISCKFLDLRFHDLEDLLCIY